LYQQGGALGMLTILILILALTMQAPSAGIPRVRANAEPSIAVLLREAAERSETFRRLTSKIDATDGLVYVEYGLCHHQVRACLALTVRTAGPSRILRIIVDSHRDRDELIAAIGHELQHANEALADSHVTSDITMYNFFRRIAPTDKGRFETDAAVQVGLDVLAELRTGAR
jgi:hypothetical protein